MENKKEWRLTVLLVLGLVCILVINAKLPLEAENRELAKAVFYVTWYDMSEEVLYGLRGVERVSSHFIDPYEANTVWYDPALINIEQMEKALKYAAVYLGTVK